MGDRVGQARELIRLGVELEHDGFPARAASSYRDAVALLAAEREELGAQLPDVLVEADGNHRLRGVCLAIGDEDGFSEALTAVLDLFRTAERLDGTSVEDSRVVDQWRGAANDAMAAGDLVLARGIHREVARVADRCRSRWTRDARHPDGDPQGLLSLVHLDSLEADLLHRERRPAASAAVLRRCVERAATVGFVVDAPRRPTASRFAELWLLNRLVPRGVEAGWGPSELAPWHERWMEVIGAVFADAREAADDERVGLVVAFAVRAVALAGTCGRAHAGQVFAVHLREAVAAWVDDGGVLAPVIAGDLEPALAAALGSDADGG